MSFFPPQKLIQEIPSVYETLHNLGATLWIPPAHANGVNQFVYPDATTPLVGADAGAVVYSQDGGVPEMLGGSPQAEFPAATLLDFIDFGVIPTGDPLQLAGGGFTILYLGTIDAIPADTSELRIIINKSTFFQAANGYEMRYLPQTGALRLGVGSPAGTDSPDGVVQFGERHLYAASTDTVNKTKFYRSGTVFESPSSTILPAPPDVAAELSVGFYGYNASESTTRRYLCGRCEIIAVFPFQLTTTQLDDIAAMCGVLG